jgi:hypothetical protein
LNLSSLLIPGPVVVLSALKFPTPGLAAIFRTKNSFKSRDDATVNMFWQSERLLPLAWASMRSFVERGHRSWVFCHYHSRLGQ